MSPSALAAVVLAVVALGVAGFARLAQRRRAVSSSLDLGGLPAGLILFTDAACRRCPEVRAVMQRSGHQFTEVNRQADPERFAASGVTAVPLVVARGPAGDDRGRVGGRVTGRALRRLAARLG